MCSQVWKTVAVQNALLQQIDGACGRARRVLNLGCDSQKPAPIANGEAGPGPNVGCIAHRLMLLASVRSWRERRDLFIEFREPLQNRFGLSKETLPRVRWHRLGQSADIVDQVEDMCRELAD